MERRKKKNPLKLYTVKDLWTAVQTELVSLLCTYLDISDDGHAVLLSAVANNQPPSAAAIMSTSAGPGEVEARQSQSRDRWIRDP